MKTNLIALICVTINKKLKNINIQTTCIKINKHQITENWIMKKSVKTHLKITQFKVSNTKLLTLESNILNTYLKTI